MTKVQAADTRWVLPAGAGEIIGCSRGYVRALVDSGRLFARRGPLGYRLISRASVEEFARERALRRAQKNSTMPAGRAKREGLDLRG